MALLAAGIPLLRSGLLLARVAIRSRHLGIGRRHRTRPSALLALPLTICVHDAEIVLGVLVEVLCRYAIAARRRLPRERDITREPLVGIAADLDARTVAGERLHPVRHARPIRIVAVRVVRVIGIVRVTPASLVLSWSHDTFEIAGRHLDPVVSRLGGRSRVGDYPRSEYPAMVSRRRHQRPQAQGSPGLHPRHYPRREKRS